MKDDDKKLHNLEHQLMMNSLARVEKSVEKIHDKVQSTSDKVIKIEANLGTNTDNLAEHMRRTEILENEVHEIRTTSNFTKKLLFAIIPTAGTVVVFILKSLNIL